MRRTAPASRRMSPTILPDRIRTMTASAHRRDSPPASHHADAIC
jgi:hypothetical protein